MRYIPFFLLTSLVFIGTACSSSPKYAPDSSLTRKKAENGYSNLEQETGNPQNWSASNQIDFSANATINPIFMVMPSQSDTPQAGQQNISKDPMSKAMMESINGYLTKKKYEVKSLEGQAQLDNIIKMQNDIANTDDDYSYLASLTLGADIYIKYAGSVQTDNVTVEVYAYETSTGKLLGSQTAEVKNNGHTNQTNLRANIQSAARKAMPNLEQKIIAYWKADMNKGQQYKVVMNLKGELADNQIEDLHDFIMQTLKHTFNSIVVNVMTDKTIDLVVYVDPNKYADSQEVYSKIRNALKSNVETKKLNITKKLILMDLK